MLTNEWVVWTKVPPPRSGGGGPCEAWWRGRAPHAPSDALRAPPPPRAGEDQGDRGGSMRAPAKTFRRARELRRRMTLPEVVLWQALRQGRLAGLRFRRQHPIGPYVLDFYCPSACLAVEVDGLVHDAAVRVRRDARRDAWLDERGVRVMRVTTKDVLHDEGFEGVLTAIENAAGAPSVSLRSPPPPRSGGGTRLWAAMTAAALIAAAM
ncbi:MAG TPA: endonuclease domain-containing protein, partial [Stellaceae bacterium]|nr:endonuclease domain-containing protein [Stellaceae bacterium]